MPSRSITENRRKWNEYNWSEGGEEWTREAENVKFKENLLTLMHQYLKPNGTILEIGPGAGRWTEYLQRLATNLILIDIAPKCIDICKTRFADKTNLEYHLISDINLSFIPASSVNYIWSYDVFVHINPSDARQYMVEFARIMMKGAVGIIHHPNTYRDPRGFRSMLDSKLMQSYVEENALKLIEQNGDIPHKKGDVITVFQK